MRHVNSPEQTVGQLLGQRMGGELNGYALLGV
jgi:hypothetical protein